MVKGDAAAVKDMLADDWRVTGPDGTHDKAETLAAMKDGTLKYLVMDKSKVEVRVYGDAAVVTGTIRAKISVGGKEQTSTDLYTEVLRQERRQVAVCHRPRIAGRGQRRQVTSFSCRQ